MGAYQFPRWPRLRRVVGISCVAGNVERGILVIDPPDWFATLTTTTMLIVVLDTPPQIGPRAPVTIPSTERGSPPPNRLGSTQNAAQFSNLGFADSAAPSFSSRSKSEFAMKAVGGSMAVDRWEQ